MLDKTKTLVLTLTMFTVTANQEEKQHLIGVNDVLTGLIIDL